MRLVLYTQTLAPIHIIDLDDWAIQALGEGPAEFEMAMSAAFSGPGDGACSVRLGAFSAPNIQMPFLVLSDVPWVGMLASDLNGAFPQLSDAADRFRKEFSCRLQDVLMQRVKKIEEGLDAQS